MEIEKNGTHVFNMADLFEFEEEVVWDDFFSFGSETDFMAVGETRNFIRLSLENLRSQKFNQTAGLKILDSLDNQFHGLNVKIEYKDIMGKNQPLLSWNYP